MSGDTETRQPPRRVRILHMLPDLDMGGGQQLLRCLLEGMDRARFAHCICYFRPNHEMRDLFEAVGASVQYVPHEGRRSWFRTLPAVVRLIRDHQIDIVHINGTPLDKLHGQLAALLCRKPVVSTLHGPLLRPKARRARTKRRVREFFEHVLDPWTTRRVLAVSQEVLESWRPYLESRHVSRDRMLVNRNGIPTARFDRDARREEIARLRRDLGDERAHPALITVGRLDANKAHHYLLEMTGLIRERWPEARLYIVGKGPLEAELRAQIAELGLGDHVTLLGRRDDVAALLGMSDIFVFSSLSEGLPLAVLEAMAAELPVVAFRLPGLADIVEEGVHGFQVEPRDVDAMAERVLELAGNPAHAQGMGRRARELVAEQYDLARSVCCLEHIYTEVARG